MTGQMLVIAEKPSVAKTVAKALGAYQNRDGYMEGSGCIVSWCFGHLAEYAPPEDYDERYRKWDFMDLPIIPTEWEMAVAEDKKKQFSVLKRLLHRDDVETAVNACDAGREGELIFWNVYELAGAAVPVKRLWISSMEESAVMDGFRNLKDASCYKGMREAAVCRARADWLVGINATRGFSTKYGKKLLVGRVQSPTLAMAVERQRMIDGFAREAYFTVALKGGGITAVSGSMGTEEEADALAAACRNSPAVVTKVEKKEKRESPPKLYDLTGLQRDANRLFGYTAQQTLDALQELYEKKLVTYPRTDSRYITGDMEKSTAELLDGIAGRFFFAAEADGKDVRRLICDSKVSDHHAILPTSESMAADMERLPERHRNIYLLVAARLASAAAGERISDITRVEVSCAGHIFTAKGAAVLHEGFAAVDAAFMAGCVNPQKTESADTDIPAAGVLGGLSEGTALPAHTAEKAKHFTSPPKPYTEDTLLAAMEKAGRSETEDGVERKGIGTPATRAGTIEKLVSAGYLERKGRKILPTAEGTALAGLLPDKMKSPSLTAAWENRLLAIEKGTADADRFMEDIISGVDEIISGLSRVTGEEAALFSRQAALGKCPNCGKDVLHGRYGAYCQGRCGMSFKVFGKAVPDQTVEALLKGEPVRMRGKDRKTGKPCRSTLMPNGVEPYSAEKNGRTVSGYRFAFRPQKGQP
ncbi:MAG: DNA topoisomerase III [Lachnospiraceae bacterium]|nr:DNA topoisomerase III [Lachnospiraceae bacterium]